MSIHQVLLTHSTSTPRFIDVIGQSSSVAYGLRKLRANYTGSAIRVRRVSDSTEQDIGFNGESLDWAATISFMGASSLTVVTWYDQSSNAKHATQATTANQPVLDTVGQQVTFDGTNDSLLATSVDLSGTNKVSFFLLSKSSTVPGGGNVFNHFTHSQAGGGAQYFRAYQDASNQFNVINETGSTSGHVNTYNSPANYSYGYDRMVYCLIDRTLGSGVQTLARMNRIAFGTNSGIGTASTNFSNANLRIGASLDGSAQLLNGSIKEFVLFPVALNTTERNNGETNIQTYHNTGFDFDASAFIAAAGITDGTQKSAINQLVLDVKAISTGTVWRDRIKATYPYVGGTSTTHKWNLKDPRDLDAAFRGVFNGGGTHNANGYTPNGTNGYMDTKFNGSVQGVNNNHHSAVMIRGTGTIGRCDIGAYDDGAAFWTIKVRNSSTNSFIGTYSFSGVNDIMTPANTSTPGFYLETRRAAADAECYKNGVSQATTGDAVQNIPNRNVWVGALGQATSPQYSDNNFTFASLGTGLIGADVASYNSAVTTFNTTLGRL